MSGHVVERLSPFLDGELPEAERREVESHLEGCAECEARLAELAAVDDAARGLEVEAPAGYFEALPGRVRQRLRSRAPRRLPVWGWAAAAALLIAVLLPRISFVPSPPPPAAAARSPEAPPPTQAPPARELAPEAGGGRADATLPAAPPPGVVVEQVRPATKRAARPEERSAFGGAIPPATGATGGPEDAGRPLGTLKRDEAPKTEAAPAPVPGPGYVTPPASAAAPLATRPEVEERTATDAEQQEEPAAVDRSSGFAAESASKARRKQAYEEKGLADARDKDKLASTPRSAAEARTLRERARERARLHPGGAEGDEARLQVVEAGARAYELGGDPRDLEILKQDAQAYLARPDARHPERVRERLRSLEERL